MQACGFEILYDIKRKSKADEAAATAVHDVKVPRALTFDHFDYRLMTIFLPPQTYDFEADREWKAFFHTLEGLGYFQVLTHFIEVPVRWHSCSWLLSVDSSE